MEFKRGDTCTHEIDLPSRVIEDGVKQLVGVGFPEGVVAANVGSVYTDKNATNGAIRWIKKSGTGNTGWIVMHGDTGWRNIGSVLSKGTGIDIDLAEVKRVNDTVYWNIKLSGGKASPANKETVLWSMPEGFQMSQAVPFIAMHETADKDVPCIGKSAGGAIEVYRLAKNGQRIIIATSQATSRAWPTTLPGTPA